MIKTFRNPAFARRALMASSALAVASLAFAPEALAQASIEGPEVVDGGGVGSTRPSPWNVGGVLTVGEIGGGTLTISNGGVVSSTFGTIGSEFTSTGVVTVTGAGSSWTNSDDLRVGHSSDGTLTISDGGAVSNNEGRVGNSAGSTGAATITGANSTWTNSGQLYVGHSGTGTLAISDGGVLSNTNGIIGRFAGSTGEVLVTGAGSTWTNTSSLSVGESGDGTLTIEDGGAVSNTYGVIGGTSGSGEVTVTGAGSEWTNSNILHVGWTGNGTLIVENGGAVSNTSGIIGDLTGSTGVVTVTGAGAQWTNSGALSIGARGDGTLTVADDGAVSATNVILANYASSTGTLNFGAAAVDAATAAGTLDTPAITFGAGGGTIVFNHTDDDFEVDADISGFGTIRVLAGRTILSGDNSYGGSALLEGGTLTLGSDTALGTSTLTTLGSVVDYADGVTIANDVVIDSDTTQFQVLAGSATQSGVVSEDNGPRPFEKIGDGELILTAANTWTGETTVSAGTLTFDGGSVALTAGQHFYVGRNNGGDAALNLVNGGTVSNAIGYIGLDAGSTGEVTVTGDGSTWTNGGGLYVGGDGEGALTIEAGAEVSNVEGVVGRNAGSTGAVTVTGAGSSWSNSNVLYVGWLGDGALSIEDGGVVSNTQARIGDDASSNGTVLVTGGGSEWASSSVLWVGFYGAGALQIADGGRVSNASGTIGRYAGSTGEVTVTGAGSAWNNSNYVYIGYDGAGTLTVADRGVVTSTGGFIAYSVGSTGAVTVTGAGSSWSNSGSLRVGYQGDGALTVEAGGVVSNTDSRLGSATGSTGAVIVTGVGSSWINSGEITVGGNGDGILTISDGGAVSASRVTLATNANRAGTLNFGAAAGDAAVAAGMLDTPTIAFGDGDGVIVFNHTDDSFGLDADISGAGVIRVLAGRTTLSGANTHTGGTEIADGELRIGDGGTTGSLDGDVVNDGVLTFDRSNSYTFSGAVSGTGDLVHAGTGVLRLTGVSSNTGATRVEAGILDLSTGDNRLGDQTALWVQSGGAVEIGTTSQQAGSISGDGVITGDYLAATDVHAGQLYIGGDDQDAAFSGRLLVGTVNKIGDGTQTLSGTHELQTLGIFGGAIRIGSGGWLSEGVDAPNVAMIGGLLDLDGQVLEIGRISDAFVSGRVDLGDGGSLVMTEGSATFSGVISGHGSVVQQGDHVFTLGGATTFTGLLDIQNGTVRMGASGSVNDALNLTVSGGATFDLNDTDQGLGTLTGAGRVAVGAGSLSLGSAGGDFAFDGDFAGTGDIILTGGALSLEGDSSAFGGTVTVNDGAALTGSGAVGGLTTIADGGVLSGVQGQTLGLGDLVLGEGSIVAVALGAPGDTALFDVAGDLTLDGELEVTDVGGFGAGVYRLFDYGGDLNDNGLDIGGTPAGVDLNDLLVQTSVDSQVNLISTAGVELRFWDGSGPADDGAIQGGAGTWSLTGRGWTGADGAVNGAYDNPAFAVFMGTGGTVTVDGAGIGVTGMQFAVDGYEITGDGIELTEDETIFRVGDGTGAGTDMTATIASSLTGAGGLVKTGLGTLILTGTNSYEGGTFVQDGTLIGDADAIAGDVVNDATLVFDQARMRTSPGRSPATA